MTSDFSDLAIKIIRSNRKSVTLQINPPATVIVRAPLRMPDEKIQQLLAEKEDWIVKNLAKLKQNALSPTPQKLTEQERLALCRQAKGIFRSRVLYWSRMLGLDANLLEVSVRTQKSRWGSCNNKGHLSFNALLLLAPPEVLDSVVVHELCHLFEMNHSRAFYNRINTVFPQYDTVHRWLKQHGGELMARLPEE